MSRTVHAVEMILYYRPNCPFCRLMDKLVRQVLSTFRDLSCNVSYTKVSVDTDFPYFNPLPEIARDINRGEYFINIGREAKTEKPWHVPEEIIEYAHKRIEVPILEIRVHTARRGCDKFYIYGFGVPLATGEQLEEAFGKMEKLFLVNLVSLLKVFVSGMK